MLQDCLLIDNCLLSFEGHLEVVALLINHGAEVTCKDKKGYTPLHAAASNGQINIVKQLLNLGVEVCGNAHFISLYSETVFSSFLWMLLKTVTSKEKMSRFPDHLVLHVVYLFKSQDIFCIKETLI